MASANGIRAGSAYVELTVKAKGFLSQIDATLGAASATDLALATDIAGNTLRAFGMDAAEMGRVCDVLTATANGSAQTVEDLGEALKFVAPIASIGIGI